MVDKTAEALAETGVQSRSGAVSKNRDIKEKAIEKTLALMASLSVVIVLLIVVFIFSQGIPIIRQVGLINFITSSDWNPTAPSPSYGILSMIIGSGLATFGALLFGVPLGLACAVFMAEIAPRKTARALRPAIELLAGIPSVVYGFFGMVVVVPFIRMYLGALSGFSILAGAIILAIMILPTIINIAEDAIRAVPRDYKQASLALGATQWQTIWKVLLPAAKSGIIAAVILGMGRAIGETMAVIMVMGGTTAVPGESIPPSILKPLLIFLEPARTMTATIAMEMGYAAPEHKKALFAIGIILFVIVFCLNLTVNVVAKKKR